MYVPAHFREPDRERCHELVRQHPFGLLLCNGPVVPEVTHLPLHLEVTPEGDRLLGHLARANPHARMLKTGQTALAVFSGTHGYITPHAYQSPDQVPTWNYRVVHAHGTLRCLEDDTELMRLVDALTEAHEGTRPDPWQADWSNPRLVQMLKAIVGFELQVERWEGKAKLSQNRAPEDQQSLRDYLLKHNGSDELVQST